MADGPSAVRIRARCVGDATHVQLLLPHPMETGLRTGDDGRLVPAHYITEVTVRLGDRTVLAARFGIGVSRDPLLGFRCRGASPGERISVAWVDSAGLRRQDEATVG